MTDRLVFITQYFAPAWSYGGPPAVLYRLTRELIKLGFSVDVITTDALDNKRQKPGREVIEGVNVYRFPTFSNYLAYNFKLFYVPFIQNKISRILEGSRYVFFSDLRAVLNWQVYPLVKSKGIPYGIFAFGQIPYDAGLKGLIKKTFDLVWVNDFVKSAKFRFCQTEHEREMYQMFHIPKHGTQLLLLPVDYPPLPVKKQDTDAFRKRWGISPSDFTVLFVGRLHYLKGIDMLLDTLLPLLTKDEIKLLIVGRDDGEEKKLKTKAGKFPSKNVIFTGPLYGRDIAVAYQAADCFATTPRFYEETPTAALEALSYGLPVITTPQGEIPFLDQFNAGFSVDSQSQVADKIRQIRRQKQAMSRQARQLVKEKYEKSIIADILVKLVYPASGNRTL